VVDYLNANSPYANDSGWAKTKVRFSWSGSPAYTDSEGVITATVTSPTVTMLKNVDMPQWSPTNPAMASAWGAMCAELRVHETRHEAIATTWESTLRSNLSSLTVTVPDRTTVAFTAAVQAEWDGWLAQHQADQSAIDPFSAVLDCSGGESEDESEESTGAEGEVAATGEE
jgi:predicted secreted Zn-dependent protease